MPKDRKNTGIFRNMTALFSKPKRDICPGCNATGQEDKVWRGNLVPGTCRQCNGIGWRRLKPGEAPGNMRIPRC